MAGGLQRGAEGGERPAVALRAVGHDHELQTSPPLAPESSGVAGNVRRFSLSQKN
jgi:hypothetical protein